MQALLARATRQELACQVAYFKEENRILGSRLPERFAGTPREKKCRLRAGQKLDKLEVCTQLPHRLCENKGREPFFVSLVNEKLAIWRNAVGPSLSNNTVVK